MIFDDAVMNNRETVTRHMRVCIAFTRNAMRRPAGVRDSDRAGGGGCHQRLLEHSHLADGSQPLELLSSVEDGDSCRVVAAVFEPAQAFHQNRDDVALSDGSDDSAHTLGLTSADQRPLRRSGAHAPFCLKPGATVRSAASFWAAGSGAIASDPCQPDPAF